MMSRREQRAATIALMNWFESQDLDLADAVQIMTFATGRAIRMIDSKKDRKRGIKLCCSKLKAEAKSAR